jgi:hypothetical protein
MFGARDTAEDTFLEWNITLNQINSKEIYDVIVEQSDMLLEDIKYTEFKDK